MRCLCSSLLLSLLIASSASAVVTIDWVGVGNAGNACETQGMQGCFGDVAYGYQISKYEVTNAQYAELLNAVAAADPNGLYSTNMGSSPLGGILRGGISGSFTYTVIAGTGDMPVNFVSFYDAARFANWLHNGQPSGAQDGTTTEDGAYTFSGPTTVGARNAAATIFLPSEDEWYKAAYHDALGTCVGDYCDYPAGSDEPTTCAAPTATANQANCNNAVGDLTNKGSYTGSASPYGTFDQGGNVLEWSETIIIGSGNRVARGGYYGSPAIGIAASIRGNGSPSSESDSNGFRFAPEPGRDLLFVVGVLGLLGLAGWRGVRD